MFPLLPGPAPSAQAQPLGDGVPTMVTHRKNLTVSLPFEAEEYVESVVQRLCGRRSQEVGAPPKHLAKEGRGRSQFYAKQGR